MIQCMHPPSTRQSICSSERTFRKPGHLRACTGLPAQRGLAFRAHRPIRSANQVISCLYFRSARGSRPIVVSTPPANQAISERVLVSISAQPDAVDRVHHPIRPASQIRLAPACISAQPEAVVSNRIKGRRTSLKFFAMTIFLVVFWHEKTANKLIVESRKAVDVASAKTNVVCTNCDIRGRFYVNFEGVSYFMCIHSHVQ